MINKFLLEYQYDLTIKSGIGTRLLTFSVYTLKLYNYYNFGKAVMQISQLFSLYKFIGVDFYSLEN